MENEIISEKLIHYRKAKGLTQIELADKINYSDKVISKWERGDSLPGVEALMILADFYNVTVNHFVSADIYESDTIENYILSVQQTEGPSLLMKLSILGPTLLFVGSFIYAFWNTPSLFVIATVIFIGYNFVYSSIVAKVTFVSEYQGHKIKIVNRFSSLNLFIDDKLVDSDNRLFAFGSTLTGKILNSTIKAKISANFFVKCFVFVE